jgi:predicted dehydrogenase
MAIEVVIAGLGRRGREWIREVSSSAAYQLAACVDVDPQALNHAATELNVAPQLCFTDLRKAIDSTRCQAAIVSTPSDAHVEACQTALARGLGVLVEKPFTLQLSEAKQLVATAEQQRLPLLVAQNYRYLRSFRKAKHLIQEDVLGPVGIVTSQYYRPPHDIVPSLARLEHSVIWGMAIHHLDALRHALGREVINVAAESYTLPAGRLPNGASFRALLSFEGGTRATYSATYESSGHQFFERGQEFYTRFVGARATLHVFQRWLILCANGKLPRVIRRGPRKVTEEQVLLQQFERALLHGETAEVSGRDNLQTMAVVEACLRSASGQTWINPQELLNGSS